MAAPLGMGPRLLRALCTGGGLGFGPVAPGTWGALPGLLLVPVIHGLPIWYVQAAVLALLALVAVPIASWGERHFQTKDPSPVVIDEIISIPITAAFAPLSVAYLAIGFVLNRAADIVKPPPARQLQALPRGWGIVIDDVLSGLYAGLLLLLTHRFAGGWLASNLPSWLTTPLPAAMH